MLTEAGGLHHAAQRLLAPLAAVLRRLEHGREVVGAGRERGGRLGDLGHLLPHLRERVSLARQALLHGLPVARQRGVDLRDERLDLGGDFLGHVRRHAPEHVRARLLEGHAEFRERLVVARLGVDQGLPRVVTQLRELRLVAAVRLVQLRRGGLSRGGGGRGPFERGGLLGPLTAG